MNELYISRRPETAERKLGDEFVLVNLSESRLFCLNSQAAMLWENADGRTPLRDIVAVTICRQYEVNIEQAYADAQAAVRQLADGGVLQLSTAPIHSPKC